ncbi:MAG TPA: hypothetical protein VJ995_07655 [Geothermobacteraceae bacterium]|nr:hypothetical protein [Geothermobacteraceae bacterium]
MSFDRSIEVNLHPELLRLFYPLFQEGVEVEVEVGCSIKELLTDQFGIASDYIAGRITTLFLNHRAVDDAATALIHDGAVLALSGAMPGLVGATMRSGGHYAAMRGAMTYRNEGIPESRRGTIKLKLYNLLLAELGPRLLMRGILLSAERLSKFLTEWPERLRVREFRIDGQKQPVEQFRSLTIFPDGKELFNLRVQFGDES